MTRAWKYYYRAKKAEREGDMKKAMYYKMKLERELGVRG